MAGLQCYARKRAKISVKFTIKAFQRGNFILKTAPKRSNVVHVTTDISNVYYICGVSSAMFLFFSDFLILED